MLSVWSERSSYKKTCPSRKISRIHFHLRVGRIKKFIRSDSKIWVSKKKKKEKKTKEKKIDIIDNNDINTN